MNKRLFLIAVASFIAAPFMAIDKAKAAPEYIQCPMASVQSEVVTRLPPSWNTQTQTHRLRNVRVVDIAGRRQLLECNYENSVQITSNAPRRKICEVDGRTGFKCDVTTRSRPVTFYTSEATLNPRDVVNLDGSRMGTWDGDLWLDGITIVDARLSTFGDATLAMPGRGEPGYEGCARQRYQSQAIRITELQEGDYLCVKTSEGRYSQIRINRVDLRGFVKVKIGFMTWDR